MLERFSVFLTKLLLGSCGKELLKKKRLAQLSLVMGLIVKSIIQSLRGRGMRD